MLLCQEALIPERRVVRGMHFDHTVHITAVVINDRMVVDVVDRTVWVK